MARIKKASWGGKRAGAGRKPKNAAFEGAQFSPNRTMIYMPGYEAKDEMQSFDLCQLRTKSRWFVNNNGLASRAIEGVSRYVVGTGIFPQARASKTEWNKKVEQAFEDKCGTAAFGFDVAGQVNFYEAEILILKQALTDGDFFGQPMLSQSGAALMRFIGGEYVGSEYARDSRWKDGVMVDAMGRPTKYRVITGSGRSDYRDISSDNLWHFKRNYRHGFVRGVPALRHAVNHLHDMEDIKGFTKGAFKLASQIAFVLESAEAGRVGLGGNVISRTDAAGKVTFDTMYPSAGHVQMKPGEKLTPLKNEHPGENFDPLMNFLIRDIAWGVGVSPEILWAIAGIGGANTRYVLADAQTFFEELQQWLINNFCRRFWLYWLWHEIEAGRIEYPGEDWWRHDWQTPGKITVDFAKDGKFLADLVNSGNMSRKRFFGVQGLDAETEDADIIRDRARRKKQVEQISKEEGVELTLEECFPPPPGSAQPAANTEPDSLTPTREA